MDEERTGEDGHDPVVELNFVPQWARRPPGANPYANAPAPRPEARGRDARTRDRPAGGRARGAPPHRGGRPPRPDRGGGERAGREARGAPRPRPAAPVAAMPLDIAFLPERQPLGGVVRRIQASRRAYPLLELAAFFLGREAFHAVKIEVPRGVRADTPPLAQCSLCGVVAASRVDVAAHVTAAHAEDLFEVEVEQGEPPAGAFVCVVRCRRDGTLIGPPNHHATAERMAEIRAARFAELSEEAFQAQLETVRDADAIAQWREEARTQRRYRRKDLPEAPPMTAMQAQAWLRGEGASAAVREGRRFIVSGAAARRIEDPAVREALRDAWQQEERFPRTMMTALRPALRHMGLHLFHANAHALFVTAIAPSPVSPDHAVPTIRRALEHLEAHPGARATDLFDALLPETPPDDPRRAELQHHLHWLIEKGHVIAFHDGALAAPRGGTRPMREKAEKLKR